MDSEEIDNFVRLMDNKTQYKIDELNIIQTLFDVIFPEIKFDKLSKQANHIALVISELYSCHKSSYDCVGYSRSKNDYSKTSSFPESGMSFLYTMRIIDSLALEDYIDNSKGYYDHKKHSRCRIARMRARTKLVMLIESVIQPEGLYTPKQLPVLNDYVFLNNFTKKKIEYQPNDLTNEWNDILFKYNKLLLMSAISTDNIPNKIINTDKTIVCRTFSNLSLGLGGRFYGAWWIQCKQRKYITINNDKTVEIDYKAMQPTIAYSLLGIDYYKEIGPDPYFIDSIKECEKYRDLIKTIVVNCISCKDRNQLERVINGEINRKRVAKHPDYHYTTVIDLCILHHYRISSLFLKDMSTTFQNFDSTLAYDIIKYFTNRGIPTLTVHDSFICQEQYQEELNEYMVRRFKEVFGVSVKTKVT